MFGHRVQGGVRPGLSSGGHKFSLILLSVWLGGCLPVSTRHVTMLSAEERAQAAQLPVHTAGLPTGSSAMVESVRGLSCRVNQADGTRVSEAQALEELRRAAFRAGGDAVINLVCAEYGRGQGPHNCVSSVECRGDAVRTK